MVEPRVSLSRTVLSWSLLLLRCSKGDKRQAEGVSLVLGSFGSLLCAPKLARSWLQPL